MRSITSCLQTLLALPLFLGTAASGHAQTLVTQTGDYVAQAPCEIWGDLGAARLTDGNTDTAWASQWRHGPCQLIYRFDEPTAISGIRVFNAPTSDWRSPVPRVVIWASHQETGRGFFRVGEGTLATEGESIVELDEPVLARTIKVSFTQEDPYSAGTFNPQVREMAFLFEDASTVSRWPMPPLPAMADSDPIGEEEPTSCDVLAGFPHNRDNYGYGLEREDIDVGQAMLACQRAVALNPQSARLQTNLARVEGLAEMQVQAVARLGSDMLASYPPAQYLLAGAFAEGLGVAENAARARALYQQSADAGFLPAHFQLVEAQEQALAQQLAEGEQASATGSQTLSPSMALLIEQRYAPVAAYYDKFLARTDPTQLRAQLAFFEDAAEYGAPASFSALIWNNQHGIAKIAAYASRWVYEDARRSDDPTIYGNAVVVQGNTPQGVQFGRRGAYSFESWPLAKLAELRSGEDRQRLDAIAFAALSEHVASGASYDSTDLYELGEMYRDGRGTQQDRAQAAYWIVRAAQAGSPRAVNDVQTDPSLRDLADQVATEQDQ